MEQSQTSRPYASLLRRYQALVFDSVLYGAVLAGGVLVPGLFGLGRFGTGLCFASAVAFILTSEPLLVGLRGGTIGHFHYKIRVWDASNDAPIGIPRALGRAVVKGLLGIVSLVLILLTARAQSLHDLLFHSVVVPADPQAASATDVIVTQQIPVDELPSRWRRVIVISAYTITAFIATSAIPLVFLSEECLLGNGCSGAEKLTADVLGIGWLLATLAFVVLGWRGRLFGCRRRQPTVPVVG